MKNKKTINKTKEFSIHNCTFVGVKFDEKAVNAIEIIATGLVENAKAVGSLAAVLKASNIQIDAMLKIPGKP